MGSVFSIRHVNVMLYMTLPKADPPRLRGWELDDFLEGCTQIYGSAPAFFSQDRRWPEKMVAAAKSARNKLQNEFPQFDSLVTASHVTSVLQEMQGLLSTCSVFAFIFGNQSYDDEISALAKSFAYRAGGRALVMIPIRDQAEFPLTFNDPYSALVPALERQSDWPGILFWTAQGVFAFVPLKQSYEVCDLLVNVEVRSGTGCGTRAAN